MDALGRNRWHSGQRKAARVDRCDLSGFEIVPVVSGRKDGRSHRQASLVAADVLNSPAAARGASRGWSIDEPAKFE